MRRIDCEDRNRSSADGSAANQDWTVPAEVSQPLVPAWIE